MPLVLNEGGFSDDIYYSTQTYSQTNRYYPLIEYLLDILSISVRYIHLYII